MASAYIESLITQLSNALGHARLYPIHSSLVRKTVQGARRALEKVCRGDTQVAPIAAQAGEFVHDGEMLIGATISGYKLIELLRRCSAGGLLIDKRASTGDFDGFLRFALETKPGPPADRRECQARLEQLGCRYIQLAATDEKAVWFDPLEAHDSWNRVGIELGESVAVYQTMFENVEGSMRQAASGDCVDMNEARTVSERMRQASTEGFDNVFQLANASNFDTYTVGHSVRVALLAVYVASQLDTAPDQLTEIGAAGLMHDVGKARVPHEILYKPARLDREERRVISEHPTLGAEILIESEEPSACALGAAWGHHLRYDGSGYPCTRPWMHTSRVTSLIQVCDVFEALTARRPYKPAMTPARAYQLLFAQHGAFDPAILSAFTRALGLYPPGRFVRLSDGRLARVHRPNRALDRPEVRVLPEGTLLNLEEPAAAALSVVDLLPDGEALQELELIHPEAPLPSSIAQEEVAEAEPEEAGCQPGIDDLSGDCRLC